MKHLKLFLGVTLLLTSLYGTGCDKFEQIEDRAEKVRASLKNLIKARNKRADI